MKLSHHLFTRIMRILENVPDINENETRKALIKLAGLDQSLKNQIQIGGTVTQFLPNFVNTLEQFGTMDDGRLPLVAVLQAAKDLMGAEWKRECDVLLRELQPAPPSAKGDVVMPSQTAFEHGYALLIGIGGNLPATANDAIGLHHLLTDPQRCAYRPANVRLLTEQQADPDAAVIVYFSGHGGKTPEYHFLPFGYNPADLSKTAVSGAEFTEKLRAVRSKKLLALLDCCHAGGMAEAKAATLFEKSPMPPEFQTIFTAGSGRVVLGPAPMNSLGRETASRTASLRRRCAKGWRGTARRRRTASPI